MSPQTERSLVAVGTCVALFILLGIAVGGGREHWRKSHDRVEIEETASDVSVLQMADDVKKRMAAIEQRTDAVRNRIAASRRLLQDIERRYADLKHVPINPPQWREEVDAIWGVFSVVDRLYDEIKRLQDEPVRSHD
jgi:hypothetical protein